MHAIMGICDRIMVLDYGRKIAEGTPQEVASNDEGHRSLPGAGMLMLEVDSLCAAYGKVQVLWDVSIEVGEGEFVALIGANGAGKTTLLNAITGVMKPPPARVTFMGHRIEGMPSHSIADLGLRTSRRAGSLFADMSVRENLEMGAYPSRSWKKRRATLEEVFGLFPRLKERAGQLARTLSGGEQQMLAMGRGLMSRPKMGLIDEPSNGLAPLVVDGGLPGAEDPCTRRASPSSWSSRTCARRWPPPTARTCSRTAIWPWKAPAEYLQESEHVRKAYLGL